MDPVDLRNLPPIPMPGTITAAKMESPPASVPMQALAWTWDRKHALATLTMALAMIGPVVSHYWPTAGAAVQEVQRIIEAAPPPKLSAYEQQLRQAWMEEAEPDKAASLRASVFLYRRSAHAVMTQDAKPQDLAEMYQAFRDREKDLQLDVKLFKVRAAIRAEWARQVPEIAPLPLTMPLRVRVWDFLRQTTSILERLS